MSVEETSQKRIPERAFCKIKLLDEKIYRLDNGKTISRPIPISLIVGTIQPEYEHNIIGGSTWFYYSKKIKNSEIQSTEMDKSLDTNLLHRIQLAHIPPTNEYYGDGIHRITFQNLSCNDFVMLSVTKCIVKEINQQPVSYSEIPSKNPTRTLPG